MYNGLLIYHRHDYKKNKWFARRIIEASWKYGMNTRLVLTNELNPVIAGGFLAEVNGWRIKKPDFVINRSRDSLIGTHFETMGSRVFNSAMVTNIANNKAKTHQFINARGILSVKTMIVDKRYFSPEKNRLVFPLVVKSVGGHGGKEVFLAENEKQLKYIIDKLPQNRCILQEVCPTPGTDIRVYVLGRSIVAAVKRYSNESFKANVSLGGKAEPYLLSDVEKELVYKIIHLLQPDFAGIDFFLGADGTLLFNEIEDVVGTRTLYQIYDFDIAEKFVNYINRKLTESG